MTAFKDLTVGALPSFLGNSSIRRIVKVYSIHYEEIYGRSPTIFWGRIGKLLKPILEQYNELEIAAMLNLHFNWFGADGKDDFVYKKLADNAFPLEWFHRNVDIYANYLSNMLDISVGGEIGDNPDCNIKQYVIQSLKDKRSYKTIKK